MESSEAAYVRGTKDGAKAALRAFEENLFASGRTTFRLRDLVELLGTANEQATEAESPAGGKA